MHVMFTIMLAWPFYVQAADSMPQETDTLQLDEETEATLSLFPAHGDRLLLWIPSYATPVEAVETVAVQLQALHIEV